MDWMGTTQDDSKVQGSKAWLVWRGKGLGSSDAAVLLGLSPWKNITELWEEKLGYTTPIFGQAQRSAMDRGKALEPKIRRWYEEKTGLAFPDDIATHPEHEFMRASFDGINYSVDRVLEIKAPNAKDHALAKAGLVPSKYIPQCQWLMMVGRKSHCDYVSFGTDDTYAEVRLNADPEMQAELTRRGILFWDCIQNKREPVMEDFPKWTWVNKPMAPDPIPQITDQEIEKVVAEALEAQMILNKAEERFDTLKEKLKRTLGDREKLICGEAIFGWQARKGAVDYGQVKELEGVDLEKYRKPDTRAFYFKRGKEK